MRNEDCKYVLNVFSVKVFPDGLVASDGRLQPGDQIIEINGCDMTCATHSQVSYIT